MEFLNNWSTSLRETFAKDCKIPINITISPFFEHQVFALKDQYDALEQAKLFNECIQKCGGENNFFKKSKDLIESVIDSIKSSPEYKDFGNSNYTLPKDFEKTKEKSVYKEKFCGQDMVSLDIVCANFQSFKIDSPNLIGNYNSYQEFIEKYTKIKHFQKSKKIRQVIFGHLNPQKQNLIQKYLVSCVLKKVSPLFKEIISVSSDEIVGQLVPSVFIEDLMDLLNKENSLPTLTVQEFVLERLPSKKGIHLY